MMFAIKYSVATISAINGASSTNSHPPRAGFEAERDSGNAAQSSYEAAA